MSGELRRDAIHSVSNKSLSPSSEPRTITDIYGEDVFNVGVMKEFLPKPVCRTLLSTIRNGAKLDPAIADVVANAMKRWAISKGATHYSHWFQPLTGTTAEKHEAFLEIDSDGDIIMNFSGKNLIQGEPDASSFPSGGIRATFEARGYTAWDPTSPAFIKRTANGATLCIPTAFCSYTGAALDKKTPLLRSMEVVARQAERVIACFGVKGGRVIADLGAEQEYFLVDRRLFNLRQDLIMTGRTLFGNVPPKHQQMEDHYFGTIKPRVLEFMTEVDQCLWRVGIPAKTRHNEAAPGQFEIAPIFEEMNVAVDHNMIVMEVLRKVADRHGFVCLLHEKPFLGVNGSGKHNNWSLSHTQLGNLFNPGKNPHENAQFLTLLCAVIAAVDRHADVLRASVANSGNEHRLGAAEAPPAIISIFFGDLLNDVLDQVERGGAKSSKQGGKMNIGVDLLPELPRDTADRNRTSPFAFTGNKFEFRAVGSTQNCAWPMTVLNTLVAEAFDEVATALEPHAGKANFHAELRKILQGLVKKHKRVIFNGDGYNDDWVKEAAKRGLPNMRTSPEALEVLKTKEVIALFEKYRVLSNVELHARYEVDVEIYLKHLKIESETAIVMVQTQIIPAVTEQLDRLGSAISSLKSAGVKAPLETLRLRAEEIGVLFNAMTDTCEEMWRAVRTHDIDGMKQGLSTLRRSVDSLERRVEDSLWPLPKYAELMMMV